MYGTLYWTERRRPITRLRDLMASEELSESVGLKLLTLNSWREGEVKHWFYNIQYYKINGKSNILKIVEI